MNRVRNMWKFIGVGLLAPLLLLAMSSVASAGSSAGWLSLWYNTSGCNYTLTAQWSNVSGAKTVEMWLEQNGARIAPTHVEPVKGKSGTVTYTFPTLATSAAMNTFQGWAQLHDGSGAPIAGTLDFTGRAGMYCTAP